MYSNSKSFYDSNTTSTPKRRRRLGTGRILRPKNHENVNFTNMHSPINFKQPCSFQNSSENCESPRLPCNQVEYLCESNSSNSYEIPCSPDVMNNSVIRDIENWESLVVSNKTNRDMFKMLTKEEIIEVSDKECNRDILKLIATEEIDEISDEMFYSKLEQTNRVRNQSTIEREYLESVEQSFDVINQSICQLTESKRCNKSSLFETKNSFLLDIKKSGSAMQANEQRTKEFKVPKTIDKPNSDIGGFYGLPLVVTGLFKTYRNIEKFYDWQEECLNLTAIKERRNLIYALPTSGGKTLVAEVLMLREVMVRKKNALFILPFVAIVQEKVWSLSPFAVQLDFLVEEYAGGKGHIPPKRRRRKNSIYIGTIEKGLALIRSLIELDRLQEIGLIVVDELHLIGEKGRGGTLETLLTTVIFANKNIQIVGMSATIGNLPDLARFMRADVFQRHFRPVELAEYVKLGDVLHRIRNENGLEVVPERQLAYNYSDAAARLDPDRLGGLVAEAVPRASVLVFCPTKRNCENVAALLCKLQTPEMSNHRIPERRQLQAALHAEGGAELARAVRSGVAFHHAGLASDERQLLEQAFRSGVISVLCCTSTLAAGVNLPAARVVLRAPRVGRDFLSLAAYRQMAGRAGRAGVCDTGESIIICSPHEWPKLRSVLSEGIAPARSVLRDSLDELLLSAVALRLADTRGKLRELLACTLMAITESEADGSPLDVKAICDSSLHSLLRSGALQLRDETPRGTSEAPRGTSEAPRGASEAPRGASEAADDCYVNTDSVLEVSKLGRAAIKGCMELGAARRLAAELAAAARALVLMGSLHLLYLVTPQDAAGVKPDYRHYYSLYCNLDEEGVQTAKILGITEMNAMKMMTGKNITNVPEKVLCRFYLAMMLHDLWNQVSFTAVAEKYCLSRGTVQSAMAAAAARAGAAQRFCEELEPLWPFRALFADLAPRLQHCAAPDLRLLMELPQVKKARALQLVRAGYKRIEDLAKASADALVDSISHLSRNAADHLISAARLMLIEKVENLRAEAEDVMEELKV